MLKKRLWGSSGARLDPRAAASVTEPDSAEAIQLLKVFEESQIGWFWSTDESGRLTYLSTGIAKLLDKPVEMLIGYRFADIFGRADDDSTGRRSLPFVLAKNNAFEKLIVRHPGLSPYLYWSISGIPQFDRSGRFNGYRGSAIDVTELRQSSEQASRLAKYDLLTGLPNRHRMTKLLTASLLDDDPREASCAVMIINLDRFKQVNDTLGHPAGDQLLKQVADRLVLILGDREKIFRISGDEFKIILQNCGDRGVIGATAKEILSSLSRPYSLAGTRCLIGASIGIAIAPVDGNHPEKLIRSADLALNASKTSGGGRFRFFSSELLQAAEDRRTLEEDLRNALSRGELSVEYQPIVCAKTNVMTGAEALVRWHHPVRGPICPTVFIPIAEETGLIGAIGDWLLRQACCEAATWPGKIRVAVNVSPIQFADQGFPDKVEAALAESQLRPAQLELEITEGIFLGESSETDSMFTALKAIGVRLALDDFGTGYSSLGYLRTAPFDKIKIDQSFVQAATLPGSRDSAIIAAIVALAEALDMETTAEGVEYADQLKLIRDLRVSHVQGWIYSKAISGDELREKVTAGDWVIEPVGPARQRSARRTIYRKIGLVHGTNYHRALVRNLSDSGALIDGPTELQMGALVLVDFGDGQITFARVTRALGPQTGIAFEQPLVDDGNGGLCTSHRVSPYLLRSHGLPSPDEAGEGSNPLSNVIAMDALAERLGLTLPAPPPAATGQSPSGKAEILEDQLQSPTVGELAALYLETLEGDEQGRERMSRDLHNHVLPRFGQSRLNQVSRPDITSWLQAKMEIERQPPGTDERLHSLLSQMWTLAGQLKLPGAEPNPLEGKSWVARRADAHAGLTVAEVQKLLEAARTSHNRQLRFILPLLMLTGARAGELLKAKWEQFDLGSGLWTLSTQDNGTARALRLTRATVDLIAELPRWEDCPYLLPNPTTRKPYRSIHRSWDVVRANSGLPHIELHDLRFCDIGSAIPEDEILALVRQDGLAGDEESNSRPLAA
ncbi:MAG TPA: EAL domain-containing protein [Allosphingosinicella sp.]|nr:EAL domain-containing protein [Allosphingosinicella sp.]